MPAVHRPQPPRRGVTLVILMIMLVVVTLVTLSSLRSTTQQERMAGNSRDRQRAFQAAEAAVQKCLEELDAGTFAGAPQTPAAATATPLWDLAATWTSTSATSTAVTVASAGLSSNPRCLVEAIGTLGSYRVTGRAVGGSPDTVVMLQATYSKE
jgi:type IV pilus assembly protein PilX